MAAAGKPRDGGPEAGGFQHLVKHGDVWRPQLVFTTHTPVPAGNETYERHEMLATLGPIGDLFGGRDRFLEAGRIHPGDGNEWSGMTALAMRSSRSTNAVSHRHRDVAQQMWRPLVDSGHAAAITYVTNGVHVPTWLQPPMRDLLDRHLGPGWAALGADPETWAPIEGIPDHELWTVRRQQRAQLVDQLHARIVRDRLGRGEDIAYADAARAGLDPDRLTIGFARRIATYKRLHLLSIQPDRARALLDDDQAVQLVVAGKAHPRDEGAKRVVQRLFELKSLPGVASRVAFTED